MVKLLPFYRQITYPSELAWACAMSHPFVSLPHLNQVRFVSSNESQRHEDSRTVFAKTMLYTIPHVMSCYVMPCRVVSRVSCPVPSRTVPHHTTSHHITSHHIISSNPLYVIYILGKPAMFRGTDSPCRGAVDEQLVSCTYDLYFALELLSKW